MSAMISLGTGCHATNDTSESVDKNDRELVVFITDNAVMVREKALSYDLKVKTIESNSPAAQLIQSLLHSPTDKFFAVINPVTNAYITGGAVSDKVPPEQIETMFRGLKQASRVGSEQIGRLLPENKENVRLVVFSDFQCPYCKLMDNLVEQWQSEFGPRLEVDMIHFPLPSHKQSFAAAEASECARQQGKFEAYKEALFDNQDQISEYLLRYLPGRLKMDVRQFNQCFTLHQERKKVRQDQYFGQYLGINGTPTVFLNGTMLFNLPPEQIKAKIQEALESSKKPESATSSASEEAAPEAHPVEEATESPAH
jgi:protein-disulfide isomerase